MSNGLALTLTTLLTGDYTGGDAVAGSAATFDERNAISWTTGAAAGQADDVFETVLNIAASGNLALDLSALTDPLGGSLAALRVKGIIILADETNVNDIVFEGGASNPFLGPLGGTTPTLNTQPGGITVLATPTAAAWAINASTAHTIKLANSSSGTAVTGKLIVIVAKE